MTSSLVGSEMCIRDSPCLLVSQVLPFPPLVGGHRGSCRSVGWFWRRPVSYTHLTLPTICSV
eukprot:8838771-Prorocentrum_lima.AAC.1